MAGWITKQGGAWKRLLRVLHAGEWIAPVHLSARRGLDGRHRGEISFNLMVEYPPKELDLAYAALAHRVRRRMLQQLRTAPARITDLARPFDLSFEAVSKHARVLETAGFAHRTVFGREHVFTLDPTPLIAAHSWIDGYQSYWEGRLDALEAHLSDGRPT